MGVETYPLSKKQNGAKMAYVPVKITNPDTKKSIITYALVDTGADSCCMTKDVADSTGHNLKGDGVVSNINTGLSGEKVKTYLHTFVIELLSKDTKKTLWKSKPQQIDCVDHNSMPSLLGCVGFLENLSITVNYKYNRITINY